MLMEISQQLVSTSDRIGPKSKHDRILNGRLRMALHNLASSAKWYHFSDLQLRKQCKQDPVYPLAKILLRTIFVNRLLGKRPEPFERCLAAAAVPSFRWFL